MLYALFWCSCCNVGRWLGGRNTVHRQRRRADDPYEWLCIECGHVTRIS